MKTPFFSLALVIVLFSSCASFQQGLVKHISLKSVDELVNEPDFIFKQYSYLSYTQKEESSTNSVELLGAIYRNMKIELIEKRYYSLSFRSAKLIQLQAFNLNDQLLFTYDIAGKFQKNGFFVIDNKYLKCWGVPLIAGGCDHEKTRIGISKQNELIVQNAYDNFGSIALIFGSGRSFNKVLHYQQNKKASSTIYDS